MPKMTQVRPLIDLNNTDFPSEIELSLPENCVMQCQQYGNHVYLLLHYRTGYQKTSKRTVHLVFQGDAVPDNYEFIGTVVANEVNISEDTTDEEVENLVEVPTDPETFYNVLILLTVYVTPELKTYNTERRWSFLGDNNVP